MNAMLRWWSVLQVAVLVVVLSEAVAVTAVEDVCFCEEGCFHKEIQYLCCTEICNDAEARNLQAECKQQCPGFDAIQRMKDKVS